MKFNKILILTFVVVVGLFACTGSGSSIAAVQEMAAEVNKESGQQFQSMPAANDNQANAANANQANNADNANQANNAANANQANAADANASQLKARAGRYYPYYHSPYYGGGYGASNAHAQASASSSGGGYGGYGY